MWQDERPLAGNIANIGRGSPKILNGGTVFFIEFTTRDLDGGFGLRV